MDADRTGASLWGASGGLPGALTSLSSDAACDSYWTSVHPEYWTKRHVWEWLQFCCDQYKLDANCISFCHFNVSGLQLCSMTQEEFVEAAGICGEYLYFILQNIRSQGQCGGEGRASAGGPQGWDPMNLPCDSRSNKPTNPPQALGLSINRDPLLPNLYNPWKFSFARIRAWRPKGASCKEAS